MKILIYTDLHMCRAASIIRGYGKKYSLRLENCVNTLNWAERLAESEGCDAVFNLGDFFDQPDLDSETITALTSVKWSAIKHYYLVGNHDSSVSSLEFNSVNALFAENNDIVTEPKTLELGGIEICLLPYIIESDRKPLARYFGGMTDKPRLILSHNDVKGIQMGPIVSRAGFDIDDIGNSCSLFVNGHLHNGQQISTNAINLGNITGKDFGEDAFRYRHSAMLIDTDTLQCRFVENPEAFNFYKIEIADQSGLSALDSIKNNAVVSVKCAESLMQAAKDKLAALQASGKIVEIRLIAEKQGQAAEEGDISELTMDHLAKFVECCRAKINNSAVLESELAEICK
jgi:DNA repair exonuclease SbcCD nuclease subunit